MTATPNDPHAAICVMCGGEIATYCGFCDRSGGMEWTTKLCVCRNPYQGSFANPAPNEEVHGYTCDARACIQKALEEFQRVLVEHCTDPTQAEILAIRAAAEARKSIKAIGRQPARFGGD